MKARDRQSHHIAIYEKVVQEAERKLKENDELIEKERQEIDRKKAERDEREKKHRKEEALSVQKALIDQMNEKKRIKKQDQQKALDEIALVTQMQKFSGLTEKELADQKASLNHSYQRDLLKQMKVHH
eukprot:TRINITY_DN4724_c0_g1_i6.p1 TRINITY_DN4724_c0_g1~~TRINITY_DN4724_c0_g1_i6.p1  ORF type:complete len:128 (-),score=42.51 TRINITY_DN4724_c0_g1_i6:441-824(-)